MISVELVYVPFKKSAVHVSLSLEHEATVSDALEASGIGVTYPEIRDLPVGIFAKRVSLDHILKEGDRIEIYRPLTLDPKENRRKKASTQK